MEQPGADFEITRELVEKLVSSQYPQLSTQISLLAHGWDNEIYRVGEDHVARLPRREVAVPLLVNEQRWLSELSRQITVEVPEPVHTGRPGHGYPWPWSVCRWLEGVPVLDVPVGQRRSLAEGLARFMSELHVRAPEEAPRNQVRGVSLWDRDAAVQERQLPRELRELWEKLKRTPEWRGPKVWVHGDPHPGNLLVDADGRLKAVIDFGDLNGGDPATDLAAAWMVFDRAGRKIFREVLSEVDDDTWARARGWALNMGSAIAAHSDGNPRMAAIGTHTLSEVLGED